MTNKYVYVIITEKVIYIYSISKKMIKLMEKYDFYDFKATTQR